MAQMMDPKVLDLLGKRTEEISQWLKDATLEELNALAFAMWEDKPRRLYAAVERERTKRFRTAELSKSAVMRNAQGLSQEEWDALGQAIGIGEGPNETAVETAGPVKKRNK